MQEFNFSLLRIVLLVVDKKRCVVGGEKIRRAFDDRRYCRMLLESFLLEIAYNRPLPSCGVLNVFIQRQIAFIKVMCREALRLNALRWQIKNRQI